MTVACMHPWAANQLSAEVAELAGVDELWAADHLQGMFHPGVWSEMSMSSLLADPDAWYDPFLVGAALSRTSTKPFGICVTDGTRRRAADVARASLTMQHLCAGGFILGVGSGEAENLVPFGYDFERPVTRLEEFLVELRALLDTAAMPDGRPGRTGIPLRSDAGRPQVWIGGHGPRMLRLTGRFADGWVPSWPSSPEVYGQRRAAVMRSARDAGRPDPVASMVTPFALGESRDHMCEMLDAEPLAKVIGLFMTPEVWAAHGRQHPLGDSHRGFIDVTMHGLSADAVRDIAPTIPAEIVEEMIFLGTPDEICARVETYVRAGLEHTVLGNFTGVVGGAVEFEKRFHDTVALTASLRDL